MIFSSLLQSLLAAALFGLSTPLSKTLLCGLQANQLAGMLYLGAAAFFLPATLLRWRSGAAVLPRDAANKRRLALSILSGGIIGPVLLLLALKCAMASSVSMWLSLEAVATALAAFFFYGENVGRLTWLGNAGVFLAGAMLGFDGGAASWLGFLCACGAALAWGVDNNATASIDGISPEDATFWKGLVAGTFNLLAGLALFQWSFSWAWLWAALLGGASYGLSVALYIHSAQKLGATRAQMAFASAPFWGVLLSMLFLGERPSWIQSAAAALLALSIASIFFDRHEHVHAHNALAHTHRHRHDDGHHAHSHPGLDKSVVHSHFHEHEATIHSHPHCPDLHHKHH